MNRYLALFLVFAFVGLAVASPSASATPRSPEAIESRDPSGLLLVGAQPQLPAALPESLAKAWSDALWLARDNPDAFGYAWADAGTGRLIISTAAPLGESLANAWVSAGAQTKGPKPIRLLAPQVPTSLQTVKQSVRQLERIKDDATFLVQAGIPDADAIYQTEPDFEHNRVLITIDRRSDALLEALAARYGTQDIAIRVANRAPSKPAGRNNDSSPFYGGAQVITPSGGTCTSGFAWITGTSDELVSAGHCSSTGGGYYTPSYAQYIGAVTSGSGENWDDTAGTQYFTGQSTYRGDLSLIEVTSTRASAAEIYTGGNGSSTAAPVKEKFYRSPQVNDQFCTGGYNSGELCGWSVTSVATNHQYSSGAWARNISIGSKSCSGLLGGDSGGPVYTVRGDGGISAKGIISGSGSDIFGCYVYFTDIWDAYYGLPGDLMIQ